MNDWTPDTRAKFLDDLRLYWKRRAELAEEQLAQLTDGKLEGKHAESPSIETLTIDVNGCKYTVTWPIWGERIPSTVLQYAKNDGDGQYVCISPDCGERVQLQELIRRGDGRVFYALDLCASFLGKHSAVLRYSYASKAPEVVVTVLGG